MSKVGSGRVQGKGYVMRPIKRCRSCREKIRKTKLSNRPYCWKCNEYKDEFKVWSLKDV